MRTARVGTHLREPAVVGMFVAVDDSPVASARWQATAIDKGPSSRLVLDARPGETSGLEFSGLHCCNILVAERL